MKPLVGPDSGIVVSLINGYGDAFLALPALRHLIRNYLSENLFLACYSEHINTVFNNLPINFLPVDPKSGDVNLQALNKIESLISFNAYYPSTVDKELCGYFPHASRMGFCDMDGVSRTQDAFQDWHMRDQYFAVMNSSPRYDLRDRQLEIVNEQTNNINRLIQAWINEQGEHYFALHIDTLTEKMWPVDLWIDVVINLYKETRQWPLIVGSNHRDVKILCDKVPFVRKIPPKLGINAHFAAIKLAPLFLGIDSIFMHIADSYDKPIVTLFGPTSQKIWAPTGNKAITLQHESNKVDNIQSSQVLTAVLEVLNAIGHRKD